MDSTADIALAQINSKDYALPYESGERKIIKVGVNFDSKTRTLGVWKFICNGVMQIAKSSKISLKYL